MMDDEQNIFDTVKEHLSEMAKMIRSSMDRVDAAEQSSLEYLHERNLLKDRTEVARLEAKGVSIFGFFVAENEKDKWIGGTSEEIYNRQKRLIDFLLNTPDITEDIILINGGYWNLLAQGHYLYFVHLREEKLLFSTLPNLLKLDRQMHKICVLASQKCATALPETQKHLRIEKVKKTNEKGVGKQWEEILKVIREGKNNIYVSGHSLHQVAKNIIKAMRNRADPPDAQTVKRYLKNNAGIEAKNIDQISTLFNTDDKC